MSEPGNHDFLAHCVAATTGNPLLEEIRERSADAVLAVFRLIKNALVHAIDNDAVQTTAQQSRDVLVSFATEVGMGATLTFAGETVFVCGQLLRASRKVYEATLELGKLLARCGVSEVGFEPTVTREDLLAFAEAASIAVRDPERRNALVKATVPHIAVRQLDTALQQRSDDDALPQAERIIRFYGVALMVMRQFFESMTQGATLLPHRVKRLSQKLVMLAETEHPVLFGSLVLANAHRDEAGRAVQSAILAVLVARQLTQQKVILSRIAMTALMADVGRLRVVGPEGQNRILALGEAQESSIPATTCAVCIATGGINPPSAQRTVVALETTWLERQHLLGPVYGGKSTLPQAEILRAVRCLLDHLAPRDSSPPHSVLDAVTAVLAEPGMDRAIVRLLIRCLGILPASSVVEFETGEWAVVLGGSSQPEAAHLPRVRLVTDRAGHALAEPRDIDLGDTQEGRRFPRIVSIIEPSRVRFNVTQVMAGA